MSVVNTICLLVLSVTGIAISVAVCIIAHCYVEINKYLHTPNIVAMGLTMKELHEAKRQYSEKILNSEDTEGVT